MLNNKSLLNKKLTLHAKKKKKKKAYLKNNLCYYRKNKIKFII